jgi:chromosome segregation ATPase
MHTALSREYEQLNAEARELNAQNATLRSERDRLDTDKLRIEQERDQALAAVPELSSALDMCERELGDQNARLAAIYASTTWKLYRSYATSMNLVRRPLGKLKQWLGN